MGSGDASKMDSDLALGIMTRKALKTSELDEKVDRIACKQEKMASTSKTQQKIIKSIDERTTTNENKKSAIAMPKKCLDATKFGTGRLNYGFY